MTAATVARYRAMLLPRSLAGLALRLRRALRGRGPLFPRRGALRLSREWLRPVIALRLHRTLVGLAGALLRLVRPLFLGSRSVILTAASLLVAVDLLRLTS